MEVARHWRLKAQRYRLEGSYCPICGQPSFPPRPACPQCMAQGTRSAGERLLELPTTFDIKDLQSHIRYTVKESNAR